MADPATMAKIVTDLKTTKRTLIKMADPATIKKNLPMHESPTADGQDSLLERIK